MQGLDTWRDEPGIWNSPSKTVLWTIKHAHILYYLYLWIWSDFGLNFSGTSKNSCAHPLFLFARKIILEGFGISHYPSRTAQIHWIMSLYLMVFSIAVPWKNAKRISKMVYVYVSPRFWFVSNAFQLFIKCFGGCQQKVIPKKEVEVSALSPL